MSQHICAAGHLASHDELRVRVLVDNILLVRWRCLEIKDDRSDRSGICILDSLPGFMLVMNFCALIGNSFAVLMVKPKGFFPENETRDLEDYLELSC